MYCLLSPGLFLCVLCSRGNQQQQRCCLSSGKGHVHRRLWFFPSKNEFPAFCQCFRYDSLCLGRERAFQRNCSFKIVEEGEPGGEVARRGSEMLAQGTSGTLQPSFSFEAGLLPVVTQVGVCLNKS